MDLKQLDTKEKSNEGVWMDVLYPSTGEPTGLRLKLAGIDSDLFAEFSRERSKKAVQSAAGGGKKEEGENYTAELLAHLTIDWEGAEMNGEKLECTRANAQMVYDTIPIVRCQANRFIMHELNFLSESPGS